MSISEKMHDGAITERDFQRLELYPQLLGCLRHFIESTPKPAEGSFEAEMYAQAEEALEKAKMINKGRF